MLKRLWMASRPLTAAAVLMLPLLVLALVGLVVDDRLITGSPAWLKPAKFAASIGIYSLSLAWTFTFLVEWVRTRRWVGAVSAAVFAIELAIINLQAWRGVPSHFNVSTPLDAMLFSVMGAAIVLQTLSAIVIAVALWRQHFTDAALGWALRFGVIISIVGALLGGLMTRPTAGQVADMRTGHRPLKVGQHTVGAADGGPGLPGTGWSTEHGDIRVPHFVGLHALQILPLVAVAVRRRDQTSRTRTVLAASASYLTLFGLMVAQALMGEAIVAPGPVMSALYTAWLVSSGVALWLASPRQPRRVAALA